MKIQPSICLDAWGKPRKNPSQVDRHRDSNPGPPECESRALPRNHLTRWSCFICSSPIIESAKLHISISVLKYAIKWINLFLKGIRVRWSSETVLTLKKVIRTSKKFEKRWPRIRESSTQWDSVDSETKALCPMRNFIIIFILTTLWYDAITKLLKHKSWSIEAWFV